MEETKYNAMLLDAFPELRDAFEEYTAWQDGMETGCFLTYEDLLLPRIRLAEESGNTSFLDRVGDFIERLLCMGDEYAENLAIVGLLEGLWTKEGNEPIRRHLGERALAEFELFGE